MVTDILMGEPTVKNVALFAVHAFIALAISMVAGFLLFAVVLPFVRGSKSALLDAPYTPLFWGTGLVLGFLTNNLTRNRYAKWVWVLGLCWLGLLLVDEVVHYDPRWAYGLSRIEVIWYGYFSTNDERCTQECLGKIFATTPFLDSVAYSIGAMIGLRFKPMVELRRPS
jgi:hypothetical protein